MGEGFFHGYKGCSTILDTFYGLCTSRGKQPLKRSSLGEDMHHEKVKTDLIRGRAGRSVCILASTLGEPSGAVGGNTASIGSK